MSAPSTSASGGTPTSRLASWFQSRVLKPRLLAAYIWATVLTPLAGGIALTLLGAKEGFFGTVFSLGRSIG